MASCISRRYLYYLWSSAEPNCDMKIHLLMVPMNCSVASTGAPPRKALDGREVGATLGLLKSLLALITGSGRDAYRLRI